MWSRRCVLRILGVELWKKSPFLIGCRGCLPAGCPVGLLGRGSGESCCFVSDELSPQMDEGSHGVMYQHAWAGVAHDLLYPFFHGGFIAVYLAEPAGFLLCPERAFLQPCLRIFQQFPAVFA